MENPSFLQETKQHGAVRFPFNIYPCTIPGDFPQVALHWQDSMELVFVKRGSGLVQMGTAAYPAHTGDIFVFSPGTLHALRQKEGCSMEYENIIFDLELLGGAGDLCAEKYLLPLQSGRLSLTQRLTPDEPCYARAAACLRERGGQGLQNEPGAPCGAELLQRNRAPPGFWGYFLLAYGLSLSGFIEDRPHNLHPELQALCRHGSPPCFAKISLRCRRRNCAVPSYDAARPGRMRRPRGPRRPPRAAPVMCAFTAPQ